jgi:hypothetical protein
VVLLDPEAPGEVVGVLERAAGDSVDVWVELLPDVPEGALSATVRGRASPSGEIALRRVPPGSYRVQAFCDSNRNGLRDGGEPLRDLATAAVAPGETVDLGKRAFETCPPAQGP